MANRPEVKPDVKAHAKPDTNKAAESKVGTKPAAHDGDTVFFDGTVIKLDADGNEVMSDHLAAGETLRREVTDRHLAVRSTPPRDLR